MKILMRDDGKIFAGYFEQPNCTSPKFVDWPVRGPIEILLYPMNGGQAAVEAENLHKYHKIQVDICELKLL